MKKIATATLCAILLLVFGADASAFRCNHGKGLVTSGSSKAKVRLECGQPDDIERVKTVTRGRFLGGEDPQTGRTRGGIYAEETVPVEKWYYNCGSADFLYVLTFEGDTLVAEDTGGRGTGPSRCTY